MNRQNLTGLVVCGGSSTRMGQDKSLLQYHDQPQRYHIAGLLQPFCSKVFLSLNESQTSERESIYPSLTDLPQYANAGPVAALLTAFHFFPNDNFIVIGCDYPLLTKSELEYFVTTLEDGCKCSTFYNLSEGFYEPLLGFYPSSMGSIILQHFQEGNTSLQQILRSANAGRYWPQDKDCIKSVDDPESYEQVKMKLAKSRNTNGDNK